MSEFNKRIEDDLLFPGAFEFYKAVQAFSKHEKYQEMVDDMFTKRQLLTKIKSLSRNQSVQESLNHQEFQKTIDNILTRRQQLSELKRSTRNKK